MRKKDKKGNKQLPKELTIMAKTNLGITVIDLFCGAGGFSEGFHQAGFDVILGIDNWEPACRTHTINNLGETRNLDLLEFDVDKVLALKKDLEKEYGIIDVIIGSPPCTEFSYAKKGGKGDIEKGMLLVRRQLLFVALFKPKYWLMENVPRLEHVLDKECIGSKKKGWYIKYDKIGIPKNRLTELSLDSDSLEIPTGETLTASDFGTHENRKRFIAGYYPLELVQEQKVTEEVDVSLGSLLDDLAANIASKGDNGMVTDPNYPHHKIRKKDVRDYFYDTTLHPMYWEEMRHLKRRHIQYGRMHLPENREGTARTIMATYNPSSRESLILETDRYTNYHGRRRKLYRQPNVREVACIQGFPLDFQLLSDRITQRYKLIGNAVPCQLSFAIAKGILRDTEINKGQWSNAFKSRMNTTLNRLMDNDFRPIIPKPIRILNEADDIKNVNHEFKAKEDKRIRRRIMSGSIYGDSCIIILENSEFKEDKIMGGPVWKACIQKGQGSRFHQVYLDLNSVSNIIRSMKKSLNIEKPCELLHIIINEGDKGIPLVKQSWIEFPGWSQGFEEHVTHIANKRRYLSDLETFQKNFTSDIKDIGEIISPIDFFDGLDAIMLRGYSNKKFRYLKDTTIYVERLEDEGVYKNRIDPRIISHIDNARIPMATIMASLLAVHILNNMYQKTPKLDNKQYAKSIQDADKVILDWINKSV